MPPLTSRPSPMGRRNRWRFWLTLVIILSAAFCFTPVQAADVTQGVGISAIVIDQNPIIPNPTVQFTGYAGSAAVLTITRGATAVYTATLGGGGQFDVVLADQPVGEQTYTIAARDTSGRFFSPLTFILNLQLNTATILSDVFLGPTISTAASYVLGSQITIGGTTVPLSTVTVVLSAGSLSPLTATTDAAGAWQVSIPSAGLGLGEFTAYARSAVGAITSAPSALVVFTVVAAGTTNTNTAPPGSTNTTPSINTNRSITTNQPVIVPPTSIMTADLNVDRKVNLIDFSILMFYWQQRDPVNPDADINHDGIVDIVDISIMLFQWTAII